MESKGSAAACRRGLAKQLREKAPVIAEDIIERNWALVEERGEEIGADPQEVEKVIQAVLEHGFRAIEGREDPGPPPEVATHARLLAWKGLRTHTVLRRYEAGAAVFNEHLRQARSCVNPYSADGHTDAERAVEHVFKQLQDRVEHEHIKQEQELKSSPDARKRKRVKQLLSGQLIYPPEDLGYDFSATHIGVVGSGPGVEAEIKRLAQMLGGQPLIVQASPDQFWAWVGLKQEGSAARLDGVLKAEWEPTVRMGIGEPASGLAGWRCTHHQAKAVLPVAIHRSDSVVPYADVAVIASIAGDDLLVEFLLERYVTPLAADGPDRLRLFHATLSAYFVTNGNRSAAASALGMSRQALAGRLRTIEERLGQPMEVCGPVLGLALELPQFQDAHIAGT